MTNTMLRQVKLQKGDEFQYAWIDARAARAGNRVELLDENREIWTVVHVSPIPLLSEKYLKEKQRMDKHQREGSDI